MAANPNVKRERFCEEYLVDLNGTQAAIRAGYSKRSAGMTASRLMHDDGIKQKIAKLREEQSARTGITADRVINELAKIGFAVSTDAIQIVKGKVKVIDTALLTEDTRAAISEIKQTITREGGSLGIKFHDKKGALELLGKHLGIFKEEDTTLDLPMPSVVQVNVVDARKLA